MILKKISFKIYFISKCFHTLGFFSTIKLLIIMIFNKKNNHIFYIKLPKSNFYFRPKGDFGALSQFVNISYSFKVDETKSFKILDLGANIGSQTIRFLHNFPKSKILAVEAEPKNYELLKKNCLNFKNILVECTAMSNFTGITEIAKKTDNNENFKLIDQKEENAMEISSVEVRKIDYFLKKYDFENFDIIKIDINGGEKQLFKCDEFVNVLSHAEIIIIRGVIDDTHLNSSQFIIKKIFDLNNYNLKICDDNLIFIKSDSKIQCTISENFIF